MRNLAVRVRQQWFAIECLWCLNNVVLRILRLVVIRPVCAVP